VPSDLEKRVNEYLTKNSAERWDVAVSSIAEDRTF
jgi:hypothetical protein